MSRRLMLDNGPANLLAIAKLGQSDLRSQQAAALEAFVIRRFPNHKLHVPISAAVELLDVSPEARPHDEKWFNQSRNRFLAPDLPGEKRSQFLADLWDPLEEFYTKQSLAQRFRSKLATCAFSNGSLSVQLRKKLVGLDDVDLCRRIHILYILEDLQIAVGWKNANSEIYAAYQFFHALIQSQVIKNFPSVLRVIANIVDISRHRVTGQRIPNEFGLKSGSDALDCELASCLVLGSHSEEHHPVDVVTFEKDSDLIARTLAVRAGVKNWKKFLRTNYEPDSEDLVSLPLRQGKIIYCAFERGSELKVNREFSVSDLREGILPRILTH